METNVGIVDGAARMIVGGLLLVASYGEFGATMDSLAWLAWIAGSYLALTGLFHHCFIYRMFEMSSCAYGPQPGNA